MTTKEFLQKVGVINGQKRELSHTPPGYRWFNGKGEMLGQGDLELYDFYKIAENIGSLDIFIVVSDIDGGDIVENPRRLEFLSENAKFLVVRGKCYQIIPGVNSGFSGCRDRDTTIIFKIISQEKAKEIIEVFNIYS